MCEGVPTDSAPKLAFMCVGGRMHVYVLEMTALSSCTAKNDPSTADRAPGDDAQEYSILQKKKGDIKTISRF